MTIDGRELRTQALSVTNGTLEGVGKIVDGVRWRLRIAPSSIGKVGIELPASESCEAEGAVCTADGRALSEALTADIWGPATVSVSDARAAEGGTLEFEIRLSRTPSAEVTATWATADGTAEAESDYTAASGTVTLTGDELVKTVSVPVLRDAAEEDEETVKLVVSAIEGRYAYLLDAEGEGTIENAPHVTEASVTSGRGERGRGRTHACLGLGLGERRPGVLPGGDRDRRQPLGDRGDGRQPGARRSERGVDGDRPGGGARP